MQRTFLQLTDGHELSLILLLTLVLRLAVFFALQPWDPEVASRVVLVNDARFYDELAQCIVFQHDFCGDTFRTPGYPAFVALFYSLFDIRPWVVMLAHTFLDLVSVYFVFRIGRLLFSRAVGLIAAALLALDPNFVFITQSLMSDGLFVATLTAAVFAYLLAIRGARPLMSAVCAGLLLGAATMVRPVAQYYFILLLLFLLAWPGPSLRQRAARGLVLALAFAATLTPWIIRNYQLYDTPRLSSVQGDVMMNWQVAYTRAWKENRPVNEIREELRAKARAAGFSETGNPFQNDAIAQEVAVDYIKANPFAYAYRWAIGIMHVFSNVGASSMAQRLGWEASPLGPENLFSSKGEARALHLFFSSKNVPEIVLGIVAATFMLLTYAAAALGICQLLCRREVMLAALIAVSVLYFAATSGPIGLARYRMPCTPFYLVAAAYFLHRLASASRSAGGSLTAFRTIT